MSLAYAELPMPSSATALPKTGQIFRHYKGGLYEIDGLGVLESNLSPAVIYHSIHPAEKSRRWIRPLSDFQAEVQHGVRRFLPLRDVTIHSLRHYLPDSLITDAALENMLSAYDQPWRIFKSRRYVLSLFWYAQQNNVALSLEQALALLWGDSVWIPGTPEAQCRELSAKLASHWVHLLSDRSQLDTLELVTLLFSHPSAEKPICPTRALIEDLRLCYLADDWLHFDAALEMQWLDTADKSRPNPYARRYWRQTKSRELRELLNQNAVFCQLPQHIVKNAHNNLALLESEFVESES